MTPKKRAETPSWKALAGASQVKVDETAVNGAETPAPEAAPAAAPVQAPVQHAVVVRKAQFSKWPQLSTRVPPEIKEAYVAVVDAGTGPNGRELITEALEDWFIKHNVTVNDYTRELVEKAGKKAKG